MKNKNIYFTGNKKQNLVDKNNYIKKQRKELSNALTFLKNSITNTDIKKLIINTDSIEVSFKRPNISLFLNEKDARSCAIETINFSRYEPNDSNLIFGIMSFISKKYKNPSFFDVGANEGFYSITALKEFSNIDLHLFEPAPNTADLLRRNLELNKVFPQNFNQFALSDKIGTEKFIFVPELTGSSSFQNLVEDDSAIEINVNTNTLDNYLNEKNLWPDFIKIDVEGAEKKVLKGFEKSLLNSDHKPILFLEILRKWARKFGYEASHFFDEIISYGYDGFTFCEENILKSCKSLDENTLETNFLFLPKDFSEINKLKNSIKSWI